MRCLSIARTECHELKICVPPGVFPLIEGFECLPFIYHSSFSSKVIRRLDRICLQRKRTMCSDWDFNDAGQILFVLAVA